MTMPHAVVWLDHQTAEITEFDGNEVETSKVKAHSRTTKQHGSSVRTEHEFFGEVCDAFTGIGAILVTGSQTSLSDLRNYVEKHRPQVGAQIVGYEAVDHPTENQLLALARQHFLKHDRKL